MGIVQRHASAINTIDGIIIGPNYGTGPWKALLEMSVRLTIQIQANEMQAPATCYMLHKSVMRSFPAHPPDKHHLVKCSGINNPHLCYSKNIVPWLCQNMIQNYSLWFQIWKQSSERIGMKDPFCPHYAQSWVCTHNEHGHTKPPWRSAADPHSSTGGLTPPPLWRSWPPWNVSRGPIREENRRLRSELRCIESPTIGFSQLLHQAAGFLLDTVLNVPLPHAQIPQGHEGEAPDLLPSLSVAEKDSYKEGNGNWQGGPRQGEEADTWRSHRPMGQAFWRDL